MPDIDPSFLALPLAELSDAALSRAAELGCSHAEVRVERLREAFRTFRDHGLETTADRQVLGLSVRVVHDGVWGFAADIALTADAAARLAERAVATARVSRPLTPASVVLAEEETYPDATWVSAYEVDPFAVDEADKVGRMLALNEVLLAAPGVSHATAPPGLRGREQVLRQPGRHVHHPAADADPGPADRGQRRRPRLRHHADDRPRRSAAAGST